MCVKRTVLIFSFGCLAALFLSGCSVLRFELCEEQISEMKNCVEKTKEFKHTDVSLPGIYLGRQVRRGVPMEAYRFKTPFHSDSERAGIEVYIPPRPRQWSYGHARHISLRENRRNSGFGIRMRCPIRMACRHRPAGGWTLPGLREIWLSAGWRLTMTMSRRRIIMYTWKFPGKTEAEGWLASTQL